MNGLTDYITGWPWVSIVTTWFVLVDDAYGRLVAKRGRPFRASGPEPTSTTMPNWKIACGARTTNRANG